jgi:HlyD family secretion protein
MKPRTWIAGAAFASLVVAGTYFRINASTEQPALATAGVSRGDVVETVEATGTVQPVDLVEVGSQVTGSIQSLGADFNDRVEAGQVLARLDPASLQAQVDQAAATVTRLSAEVNRAQVTLTDAQ